MTTYREDIRRLERNATPVPWVSDGELYGIRENDSFRPLGFAPHRPLDSRLIVVFRSAVMQLIDAMDAIEGLALRATENDSAPSAIGIRQIIAILDAADGDGIGLRSTVADLDRRTTPPPWDPGHLVLGMELDTAVRASLGIATPRAGDCELIAAARLAVPRALAVLAMAERTLIEHGRSNGSLEARGALAIADATATFDRYDVNEGTGTGTV